MTDLTPHAAARMAEAAASAIPADAPLRRMRAKLAVAMQIVREELSDGERRALAHLWEVADQTTQGHFGYEPTDMKCSPAVVRLLAAIYEATWTDPDADALDEPFGGVVAYEGLKLTRGEGTA